jgi:hypothetical protein
VVDFLLFVDLLSDIADSRPVLAPSHTDTHTHKKKKKQGLAPCSIFTATQKMRFRHPLYHTFAFDSAKGFQSMMFQIQNDLPVRHSITFGWERHDENGASSSNLSICSCGWSVVSVGVCCCFSSIYFCSPRKKQNHGSQMLQNIAKKNINFRRRKRPSQLNASWGPSIAENQKGKGGCISPIT